MSDLIELILPVQTRDPAADAVNTAATLIEQRVPGGAVVEVSGFGKYGETEAVQVILRGYIEDAPGHLHLLQELAHDLMRLPTAHLYGEAVIRPLASQDWTEAWKEHYHPLRVGQHLVISPTWVQPETKAGDHIIWLDPGLAFGTGTHPSTQLILTLLERHLRPGARVLDVGAGSGILAIAAARLGAASVLATDIDPLAVRVAAENIRYNQVADIASVEPGSVPRQGQFDLILANILADVLAELLLHEGLAERLAPDGILLLAGIIDHRRHLVDLALAAREMSIVAAVRENDWWALAARGAAPLGASQS